MVSTRPVNPKRMFVKETQYTSSVDVKPEGHADHSLRKERDGEIGTNQSLITRKGGG